MSGKLLQGPFLTRDEAAGYAGLEADDLPFRPDLLRIGGRMLPEVYCRFQFGPAGIRNEIGTIVLTMRGAFDDLTIADWLVRPNPALRGESPLDRLNRNPATAPVVEALGTAPPQLAVEPEPRRTAAGAAAVRTHLGVAHRRARHPIWRLSRWTAASH